VIEFVYLGYQASDDESLYLQSISICVRIHTLCTICNKEQMSSQQI
jgi:hypothetical protein